MIPGISGVGEVTKVITKTGKAADNVIDAAKTIHRTSKSTDAVRTATGTYEILYKSGRNYVGKGGFERAITSAIRNTKPNKINNQLGDEVVEIIWKSAPDKNTAFMYEFLLQLRKGVGNAQTTYKKFGVLEKSFWRHYANKRKDY